MYRVLVDSPEEHVRRVMINRPEARNAVDKETRVALINALESVLRDDSCRAIVLCGAQGIFCAGGDLGSMAGMSPDTARERMQEGHELVQLVWGADVPIVAAVQRYAIGAGAGLALLSDYVIAGNSAVIAFPFLQLGLVPDWGSLQMLIRRVGWSRARKMILDKASLRGGELSVSGVVDQVVEDELVLEQAVAKAAALGRYPQVALRRFKQAMRAFPESFDSALATEEDDQIACFISPEFAEGLTAMQEKREPDFLKLPAISGEENKSQ